MKCPQCGHDNPDLAQFCGGCGAFLSAPTASGIEIAASELPMISFPEAIKLGFKNYAYFSGRTIRAEFWWFLLFTQLTLFITWVPIIGWVVGLAIIIPQVSVTTRRLHDIGKSGWWQILPWALIFVLVTSSLILVAAISTPEADLRFTVDDLIIIVIGIAAFVSFVVLIVWLVRKGDEGPNKYNPDPRQSTSREPYKP